MMRSLGRTQQRRRRRLRAVTKIASVACVALALLEPANAQFWGGWSFPQQQQPRPQPQRQQPQQPQQYQQYQQQYQQQYSPFQGVFGGSPQYQQQQRAIDRGADTQADFSRAPGSQRKQDPAAAYTVLVLGDAMADWLAYGLEDAF